MTDRPLGVAVLGTGFARTTQIPCFRSVPGFELLGIYSRNRTRAEEYAREHGIREAYDRIEPLLAAQGVDVVVVSTPPHLHLPHTLAALRAGKHVLCEKPTALHAGEAAEMLAAARASGRLHLIDHELRFHPRRRRLAAMVRDGFTGPVWSLEYRMQGAFRVDRSRPWSWWSDETKGGGVLGALGSHVVDAIRTWAGEIAGVRGTLSTMVRQRPDPETGDPRAVTADDYAAFWGRFERGGELNVTLHASAREEPGMHVTLHGEKGSLRLDEHHRLWSRADGDTAWTEVVCDDVPPVPAGSGVPDTIWARCFLLYAAAIRDALRRGQAVVPGAATFEDGLRNQAVLDAVRASARAGEWEPVRLPAGRP